VAYIYLHGSAVYFLDKDYGTPIDYKANDFVEEIYRLTGAGVNVVFDPIGGSHLWHSRKALHRGGRGGKVVDTGLFPPYGNDFWSDRSSSTISRNTALSVIHRGQPTSARSQTLDSLQHPNAQAAETGIL